MNMLKRTNPDPNLPKGLLVGEKGVSISKVQLFLFLVDKLVPTDVSDVQFLGKD